MCSFFCGSSFLQTPPGPQTHARSHIPRYTHTLLQPHDPHYATRDIGGAGKRYHNAGGSYSGIGAQKRENAAPSMTEIIGAVRSFPPELSQLVGGDLRRPNQPHLGRDNPSDHMTTPCIIHPRRRVLPVAPVATVCRAAVIPYLVARAPCRPRLYTWPTLSRLSLGLVHARPHAPDSSLGTSFLPVAAIPTSLRPPTASARAPPSTHTLHSSTAPHPPPPLPPPTLPRRSHQERPATQCCHVRCPHVWTLLTLTRCVT